MSCVLVSFAVVPLWYPIVYFCVPAAKPSTVPWPSLCPPIRDSTARPKRTLAHSLHALRLRLCWQKLFPPHSQRPSIGCGPGPPPRCLRRPACADRCLCLRTPCTVCVSARSGRSLCLCIPCTCSAFVGAGRPLCRCTPCTCIALVGAGRSLCRCIPCKRTTFSHARRSQRRHIPCKRTTFSHARTGDCPQSAISLWSLKLTLQTLQTLHHRQRAAYRLLHCTHSG